MDPCVDDSPGLIEHDTTIVTPTDVNQLAEVTPVLNPEIPDRIVPLSPRQHALQEPTTITVAIQESQERNESTELVTLRQEVSHLRIEVEDLKAIVLKQERRYDETLKEHRKLIAQLFKANQQQQDKLEKEKHQSEANSTLPSIMLPNSNARNMFNQFNVNSLISRRKSFGASDGDAIPSPQGAMKTFLPEQIDYHQAKEYYFQRAHGTSKWQQPRQLGNEVTVENHIVTRITRRGLERIITQNFGSSEFFDLFFIYHEACFEARELLDILFGALREVTAEIRKVVIFNMGVWANQNPNSFGVIANDLEILNASLIEGGGGSRESTTTTNSSNTNSSVNHEPLQESHDAIKSVLASFRNRDATLAKELKEKMTQAPEIALDKKTLGLLEKAKPNTLIIFEKIDALEIARQVRLPSVFAFFLFLFVCLFVSLFIC
jgi:hypothetical protein